MAGPKLPPRVGATILKLLVASLLVGLVLSAFSISPRALLAKLGTTAQQIFDVFAGMLEWAVPYVLLGAVVVIPIWAIVIILRIARRKRG
jgi:hypothetical protein